MSASAAAQCELDELAQGAYFGRSLTLDGDRVLVGAGPAFVSSASFVGKAHLFEPQGSSYALTATLEAAVPCSSCNFGSAVALSGTRALVGAARKGTVFVFEQQGTVWNELEELRGSDTDQGDQFGATLSIDGDRLLVGAHLAAPGGSSGPGAVYVFDRQGTQWVETAKLTSSNPGNNELFGGAVSLDGDRALIGAPWCAEVGPLAGAAFVFDKQGTDWVETRLFPSVTATYDLLGVSVSLAGDTAVVGAPRNDSVGIDSGSAFVFERQGSAWVETAKLLASDLAAFDQFGISVALSGQRIVVGSLFDGAAEAGSAYLFEKQGTSWVETGKLRANDGAASDYLGAPVSLTDELAVLVATGADSGSNFGSAYVYSLTQSMCARADTISLAQGGTHTMDLNAGSAHALELYWILGSQSGTSPGTPAPPFTMPLNFDGFFLFTVLEPNTLVVNSLDFLDAFGHARADMVLPPGLPANLAGNTYHHAYLLLDLVTLKASFVSNAVPLNLVL